MLGVRVTTDPPNPADTVALRLAAQYEPMKALHLHSPEQHIRQGTQCGTTVEQCALLVTNLAQMPT
jgi:hypothetical protein